MKKTLSLCTFALALAFSGLAAAATVGQPAPAFELKDEEGKEHSLSQYRGKFVVLEWVNPECPYVKRHYDAKTMQTTWEGSDKEKVVWLSIDSTAHNTPEKSREWKKAQGFSYPVLQDPEGKVGKLYGAKTTPHMYVIDQEGILRYAGAIDDDPRGNKETKKNYVQAALAELLAGKEVSVKTSQPYGCTVKYKE